MVASFKEDAFMEKLTALCTEYQVVIGTCSCCGIWLEWVEDMKYTPDRSIPELSDIGWKKPEEPIKPFTMED